jgi:methylmalonyl-CoA/ethylmalonyl-CoA epimerase
MLDIKNRRMMQIGYVVNDAEKEFLERRDGDGLHHVKEWVEDCQKELLEYKKRGIEVLQSGKFDEDEHYYLDTESTFGFVYEIGNNGRIRPPERRLG